MPRYSRPLGSLLNHKRSLSRGLLAAWTFQERSAVTQAAKKYRSFGISRGVSLDWQSGNYDGWSISNIGLPAQQLASASTHRMHADSHHEWNRLSGDMSVSCWIRSANVSTFQGVMGRREGSDSAAPWQFWLLSSKISFAVGEGGSSYAEAKQSDTMVNDTWAHICGVICGTDVKLYINGLPSGSDTFSGTRQTNTSVIRVGVYDNLNRFPFNGHYSMIKVWERGLCPAEVMTDYQDPWSPWRPSPMDKWRAAEQGGAPPVTGNRRRRLLICGAA